MNSHLLLSCAMILVLIKIDQSQGNNLYSTCRNLFSCGNFTPMGFPFWGGSRSNLACGHPQLELVCENNSPKITIADVKYQVLSYDNYTGVLKIARDDFSSGLCSPKLVNTTLDPPLFSLPNDMNVTFIYGCPATLPIPPTILNPFLFQCNISVSPNSGGYVVPEAAVGPPPGCLNSVVIPIPRAQMVQLALNTSAAYMKVLQQGFDVKLAVDSAACTACTISRGVCGYASSAHQPVCYCSDGSIGSGTCSSSAAGGPQGQPVSKG